MPVPERLDRILEYFGFEGTFVEAKEFGSGHINCTVRLTFDVNGERRQYVLQRLNRYIFHDPDGLMRNCVLVTEHLKKKIALRGGDPLRESVTPVAAKDGRYVCTDEDGEAWRALLFVRDTVSLDEADSPELMAETGRAFGGFAHDLSDFPAEKLTEVIPHFHDTKKRFSDFEAVVAADPAGRAAACAEEIAFLTGRETLARWAEEERAAGRLPLRVTHNDTKLNNVMLDKDTHRAVCVIDLDTVMPGFIMHDFGDAIRTGACTAAEDEPDVSKVRLDLDRYDAFARGFIGACRDGLTEHELRTLPMGALTITYEQAIRFLADHLAGDPYYKIAYPGHNLVRARTQIRLVRELEEHAAELQAIVDRYI